MKIFITGIQGVGKTYVLSELQKYGFVVIDLDATGICKWKNRKTEEFTEYGMSGRDPKWLSQHGWYCDMATLKKLLSCIRDDKKMFVAGIAENLKELTEEFDKVFLLSADDENVRERLSKRTNNHFGKGEDEQEFILSQGKNIANNLNDFILIDANSKPSDIATSILDNLN